MPVYSDRLYLKFRQVVCRQSMVREEVFHDLRDARKDEVEVEVGFASDG